MIDEPHSAARTASRTPASPSRASIPNPWLFLEATGQVYQGSSEVFKAPTRGDLAYVGHLRAYQDLGESTNIDLGGSIAYGHNGVTADTTTRLLGVDATLRWKPLRRSIYTHLLARGEVDLEPAGEEPAGRSTPSAATATSSTSSRAAGPPACATTTPSAPTTPGSATRAARSS